MTKKYTIKTALHAHPYFYCPITKKINLDEKFYRKFVSEEPSLQKIVENAFEKDVGICALSSCHTPTGGMDNRFKNYIKQLKTLDKNYDVDFHQDKGWLTIARKQPLKGKLSKIILLHSQEVRTNYNSNPADINVIGNKKLINHSLDVEETAKIAKSNGALSLVCHPNSGISSLGLEKAVEMYQNKKVGGIEGFNATEPKEINEPLMKYLNENGIKCPAVSDAHHYSQLDTAYTLLNENVWKKFSIEKLKDAIERGEFENRLGYVDESSKFLHHKLPILISIPGHLLRNPKAMIKFLSGVAKRRK